MSTGQKSPRQTRSIFEIGQLRRRPKDPIEGLVWSYLHSPESGSFWEAVRGLARINDQIEARKK